MQKYWGYDDFRPGQDTVIQSVFDGKDTLVLFPTGGGKSLCYQVPSMVMEGLTIVISPLVALMQDQVEQLQKRGIRATFINSTIPGYEVEQRLVNARNGMYKMLYIAPERLATDRWKVEQQQLNISLIAIDEAHCISEWGHNFRPSYRKIKEEFGDLPEDVRWMALTATATPEVREDLVENLEFDDPTIVTGSFERPNLQWWVTKTARQRDTLFKAVEKGAKLGSGIVYANTRRDCEKLAKGFNAMGIRSAAYHAGMGNDERERVQQKWIDGSIPVVVATNAFGMGIDKADCRFVIHGTLPLSLEAYYQEAGRAGRDGEKSYPILIYKEGDKEVLKSRIERSYPDEQTLIKTYNALCDHLELAVGSEQESAESVDYGAIAKRADLKEMQVKASMEVLQRLEILEITELYKPKIGIRFVVSHELVREFINKAEAKKGDFLDRLYRQFGPGAFHQLHYLDEEYLVEKLDVTAHKLQKALDVFSRHDQLMQFRRVGDQPLVRLLESRAQRFRVDQKEAYHYRDVLLKKLEYMHQFAETNGCREKFLRAYFGETDADDCGHCDYCLSKMKRRDELKQDELDRVSGLLEEGSKSAGEIRQTTGWSPKKVDRVVRYLVQEEQAEHEVREGKAIYRLIGKRTDEAE